MIDFADVIVDVRAGDCGKGKIAVELAKTGKYTHCLRFSGSNNAGHTIYHNGQKIVGHAIPMGIIYGVKSIIGPGCVLNVKHFLKEIQDLESVGIKTEGLIYVARNTHIITEEHLIEDQKDSVIGTTKRGNGPAYRDKYDRKGRRAEDVRELQPYLIDLHKEFYGRNKVSILCEGAQGFELDVDWGDYPFVTSSHCNAGSATLNGIPPRKINRIFGAAKIYDTYVGAKKFEPNGRVFQMIREIGSEYGSTTGRPRQCNWLNVTNMIKATQMNGITDLIINKCDILEKVDLFRVILDQVLVQFDSMQEMKDFISDILHRNCPDLKNIYFSSSPETIEGFKYE